MNHNCPFLEHLVFCTNKIHSNSLGRPTKVRCAYKNHDLCPFLIHSQSLAKDAPEPFKIDINSIPEIVSTTKLTYKVNKG